MVQRKSRLCDAEANKKLTKKNSTGTFKDTASAASRDRTLCLGPVVRHLYISHWSRVIGPSPPFLRLPPPPSDTSRRGAPLYFSCISPSPFSLSLSLPPVFLFETFCLPSLYNAIYLLSSSYLSLFFSFSVLWGRFVKQNTALNIRCISILVNLSLSCLNSWMKEITLWKEHANNNSIAKGIDF